MAARLKLIGQRYGRLLVIGEAEAAKYTRWRCRCDCGNECVVTSQLLRQKVGKRSCGCLRREVAKKNCWAGGRANAARWARAKTSDAWRDLQRALA